MAHCTPEQLQDLEPVFERLRTWPKLREKKYGTFYLRGKGFLHFHHKAGRRWADVRAGKDWGPALDCPFDLEPDGQEQFLVKVERCYQETCAV